MKIIYVCLFVLCVCCLISTKTFSQQSSLINAEKIARLDSFLQVMIANKLFNGSVVVAENSKMVYEKSAGYYSFEKKIVNSTKSQFNLASASKPFTAIAILQLVQNKKLKLDEPVSTYLKDFPFQNIKIKHLLTHTSGLPRIEDVEQDYVKNNPNEIISNEKAYKDMVAVTDSLLVKPGEKFQYNNANYLLLSLIVEKISGQRFANYMLDKILRPAGMQNTFVRQEIQTNTPRFILPTMYSTEYQHVDSLDKNKFYTYFQMGGLTGANNVVSTMEDLVLFDKALNSGKLVDTTLLNEAYTPALLNNGKNIRMGGNRSYGYGWNIVTGPTNDKTVFHDGHIIGQTTMYFKMLTKNISIFFYDNTDSKIHFQIVGNISRILEERELNEISLKKSAVREFAVILVNNGLSKAEKRLAELRADSVNYYFDELEMNSLGYDLLSKSPLPDHISLSLAVFKMNMIYFPTHPNVYDSYGDALLESGQKEEAIKMFQKVIELSPKDENAKKKLTNLLR